MNVLDQQSTSKGDGSGDKTIPGELAMLPVKTSDKHGRPVYIVSILKGNTQIGIITEEHPCGEPVFTHIALDYSGRPWIAQAIGLRKEILEFVLRAIDRFDSLLSILKLGPPPPTASDTGARP